MSEKYMLNFSKNLQIYMNTKQLSLVELSEQLGEPASTVHGWLNGIQPKNVITLKKIAAILGKSIDELCFNESSQISQINTDLVIKVGEKSFKIGLIPLE